MAQLLALDLALAVLTAGAWSVAAFLAVRASSPDAEVREVRRSKATIALLALTGAVFLTVMKFAVVSALAAGSWWFASERATIGLPLLAIPAACAAGAGAPYLIRIRSTGTLRRSVAPLWPLLSMAAAAIAATGAVVVPLLLGPIPSPAWVAVLLGVLACGVVLARLLLFPVKGIDQRRRTRSAVAVTALAAAAVSGAGTAAWLGSRAADGAGIAAVGHHSAIMAQGPTPQTTPVTELRGTTPPDAVVRHYELTAQTEQIRLPSGTSTEAWTFGSVPGPTIEATVGEYIEVVLHNLDVNAGVTIHWHGYDVPNAMDGVAGTTQDALQPGESMAYRFEAKQAGTYWYHSHQDAVEGVRKGLYGPLVVHDPEAAPTDADITVAGHTLNGLALLEASDRTTRHIAWPGSTVRLRLINTDSLPQRYILVGTPFLVIAVDGTPVSGPQPVTRKVLRLGAGSRQDLQFTMPDSAVTLRSETAPEAAIVVAPPGDSSDAAQAAFGDAPELDLFGYGQHVALPLATAPVTQAKTLVLDRQFRFVDGVPRFAYTINGEAYPQVPPLLVAEGDTVKLSVINRTAEPHPMHLHGHHVLVLSKNGAAPTSSPLLLDTVDVLPGDVWEVVFTADNPGIWMDHCHNLDHAAEGMMMHLQYEAVSSPFVHGGQTRNKPE